MGKSVGIKTENSNIKQNFPSIHTVRQEKKAMNDKSDNDLLEELRKQTALFQRGNKINLIVSVILGILIVLAVVIFPLAYRTRTAYRAAPQIKDSWQEARNLLGKGSLASGMEMTQRLIRKNPEYY